MKVLYSLVRYDGKTEEGYSPYVLPPGRHRVELVRTEVVRTSTYAEPVLLQVYREVGEVEEKKNSSTATPEEIFQIDNDMG